MGTALDVAECCSYGCDPWPSPRRKEEKLAVDKRLLKKKKDEPKP
jgi:hypothetical protein